MWVRSLSSAVLRCPVDPLTTFHHILSCFFLLKDAFIVYWLRYNLHTAKYSDINSVIQFVWWKEYQGAESLYYSRKLSYTPFQIPPYPHCQKQLVICFPSPQVSFAYSRMESDTMPLFASSFVHSAYYFWDASMGLHESIAGSLLLLNNLALMSLPQLLFFFWWTPGLFLVFGSYG